MNKMAKRLKQQRREKRFDSKTTHKAAELAIQLTQIIPAYVLHNTFGYGNKRIEKFMIEFHRVYKSIVNDEVTAQTLANELEDDCGILFKLDTMEVYNLKKEDES